MRTTDFLMSALAFTMVRNALCLGVALAAVRGMRIDMHPSGRPLKGLPGNTR